MQAKEQGSIEIFLEGIPSNWDEEYIHLYSGKYMYISCDKIKNS